MQELIELLMKKTNLSEDMAKKVVETVLDFLDDRLPSPIGGNIRKLLENEQTLDTIENITDTLGNLFGN